MKNFINLSRKSRTLLVIICNLGGRMNRSHFIGQLFKVSFTKLIFETDENKNNHHRIVN
jgi:hypothetical protein